MHRSLTHPDSSLAGALAETLTGIVGAFSANRVYSRSLFLFAFRLNKVSLGEFGRNLNENDTSILQRKIKPIKNKQATSKGKRTAGASERLRRPTKLRIGWREWIGLPELNIDAIRAKIDTGARSTSLHAKNIELFDRKGTDWVRFDVVLDHAHERGRIACTAEVNDIRSIKNSFGVSEERVIIQTLLRISNGIWRIELSLADRENMTFPVLLGRTALRGRATIDPGRSYLCNRIDDTKLPPMPNERKLIAKRKY